MGLFQSKHACKRRESPEGGTLATGFSLFQGESDIRYKQGACGMEQNDCRFLDHDCPLEVILPPEKATVCPPENQDPLKRSKVKNENMECKSPVVDENHQEWVFTLYDFDNGGIVTKEDMSSLMHTIYEVVEKSVKQSALCESKTLRVKLTVTPLISKGNRKEQNIALSQSKQEHLEENYFSHTRGQVRDPAVSPEKKSYRIDENTERRNHYLDLAGIENYTSRGDHILQSPYVKECQESPTHGTRFAQYPWPQLDRSSLGKSGESHLHFLRSLRSKNKSNKYHGHHPVSWCCPPAPLQQPLHYTYSKRAHTKPREAIDLQPGSGFIPGGLLPMAQRHEHHHLHEHHHHHHHHHYYSSCLQPLSNKETF